MAQYVFSMKRLNKTVPPQRQILKNINLAFYPGAKIGVLGLNGSGKSTILKIMAGEDKNFDGDATPMPNMRIGYLPQEPQLDPAKTVRTIVEEGMGDIAAAKKRLEEAIAKSISMLNGLKTLFNANIMDGPIAVLVSKQAAKARHPKSHVAGFAHRVVRIQARQNHLIKTYRRPFIERYAVLA